MDFDGKLFENILTEAKSDVLGIDGYDDSVYDAIEKQEDKISENADLYEVFFNINKILKRPRIYERIQSVSPAINVNLGTITISGVTKEQNPDDADVIDTFVSEVKDTLPKTLKLESDVSDMGNNNNFKYKFLISVSRK